MRTQIDEPEVHIKPLSKRLCTVEEKIAVFDDPEPRTTIRFKTGAFHTLIDWMFIPVLVLCISVASILVGGTLSWINFLPVNEWWRDTICIGATFIVLNSIWLWYFWLRPCEVIVEAGGVRFGNNAISFNDLSDIIIRDNKDTPAIGNYFTYQSKLFFVVQTGPKQVKRVALSPYITRGVVLKDVKQTLLESAIRMQYPPNDFSGKLRKMMEKDNY